MSPERQIQQARRRDQHGCGVMMAELAQLDDIAVKLMRVQRHWHDSDRERQLSAALACSRTVWHAIQSALADASLPLPLEVRQNLLILSVYAESKIGACEAAPDADALGSLIALTRSLAGSLKEWRDAA